MKRTSLWKRGIGLLLVSALLAAAAAALAGCGTDIIPSGTAQLGNLTEGLTPNKVTVNVDMDEQSVLITDFALRLLRASRREGESTLVSPLSVLYALAMTANGAEGETKGQIESALGLRIEELNEYLYDDGGTIALQPKKSYPSCGICAMYCEMTALPIISTSPN